MRSKSIFIKSSIAAMLFATTVIIGVMWHLERQQDTDDQTEHVSPQTKSRQPEQTESAPALLDYDNLETDTALQKMTDERKAKYGLKKGVDLIVKENENVKIGGQTISMREIAAKAKQAKGEIVEKDLGPTIPQKEENQAEYGVYIVQKGDNIWNIHFQLLKEYFTHRDIQLSPVADEPKKSGLSSGVGKLLKFSEKVVYIYNIKEGRIDTDINLIAPYSKIVVYQMNDVFALLDQVSYEDVDRIEFDGETLWIPASQNSPKN